MAGIAADGAVALDLTQVSFMDCSGLRALDAMGMLAEGSGGGMWLAAISAPVARILDLAEREACRPG